MKVDGLMIVPGDDIFYSKGFMDVLEAHLDYLKKSTLTNVFIVDKDLAYPYIADFYGYLSFRGIAPKNHWVCMRLNGYLSPFDFKADVDTLMIPSSQDIEMIRSSYVNSGLVNF